MIINSGIHFFSIYFYVTVFIVIFYISYYICKLFCLLIPLMNWFFNLFLFPLLRYYILIVGHPDSTEKYEEKSTDQKLQQR